MSACCTVSALGSPQRALAPCRYPAQIWLLSSSSEVHVPTALYRNKIHVCLVSYWANYR